MTNTDTLGTTGAVTLIRAADGAEITVTEHAAARLTLTGEYARKVSAPPLPAGRLTPAAKRDLATLRAGGSVDWRVGPLQQLQRAGLVNTAGRLIP